MRNILVSGPFVGSAAENSLRRNIDRQKGGGKKGLGEQCKAIKKAVIGC